MNVQFFFRSADSEWVSFRMAESTSSYSKLFVAQKSSAVTLEEKCTKIDLRKHSIICYAEAGRKRLAENTLFIVYASCNLIHARNSVDVISLCFEQKLLESSEVTELNATMLSL